MRIIHHIDAMSWNKKKISPSVDSSRNLRQCMYYVCDTLHTRFILSCIRIRFLNTFALHANIRKTVSVQLSCIFGHKQIARKKVLNRTKALRYRYVHVSVCVKDGLENTKVHPVKVNMRVYALDLYNIIINDWEECEVFFPVKPYTAIRLSYIATKSLVLIYTHESVERKSMTTRWMRGGKERIDVMCAWHVIINDAPVAKWCTSSWKIIQN